MPAEIKCMFILSFFRNVVFIYVTARTDLFDQFDFKEIEIIIPVSGLLQ